jgi:coniferyl-aldehyde dehydrogenase
MAALAAGNRVMLKPSELTPRTAEFIAELLASLFPIEKVATVLGDSDIGAALSRLPFDHLFFTGSPAVGKLVMEAAAQNLTPVTLELGGKSPCIIADDAALESAVEAIIYGKLFNAGQTCIAPDYVFVPRERRNEFLNMAAKTVAKLYPTLESNPDYTSIINDDHYRRITRYLDEARACDTLLLELSSAAETLAPLDRKIPPTLIIDPSETLALMQEEVFGPLLPVKTYGELREAIDYINRRPRPLALYYFGTDPRKRDQVLKSTVSGGASVNSTLLHAAVEELPFGGVGMSGIGAYHGEFGFHTFSHRKGIFLQSRLNFFWLVRPPFGSLKRLLLSILVQS